jgi:hypothetical protein
MAKLRRVYTGGAVTTTTSGAIASTDTSSFNIGSSTGWPYGTDPFFVVVEPGTANEEKMLVKRSGSSDTTLTIYNDPTVDANRGLDGTTAVAHASGSNIYPVFTARDADEANELVSKMTTKGDLLTHGTSTFARLGVGTNNQVLTADSNATNGIKWATPSDDIPKSIIDAKGDLIAGTGNDTSVKLGVGTNGQVLTADSAETTGMKWATPSDDIAKSIIDAKGDLIVGTADNTSTRLASSGTNGQVLTVDTSATTGLKWATQEEVLIIPISDETTSLTASSSVAKMTFRMPFAMTLTGVKATLTTASTSGLPTFDIKEGGTSILSTLLTIDANEKTSTTAATAAVISDTSLADDAEITLFVTVAGTGAKGAKIYLVGKRS